MLEVQVTIHRFNDTIELSRCLKGFSDMITDLEALIADTGTMETMMKVDALMLARSHHREP